VLILLVVLILAWRWRAWRGKQRTSRQAPPRTTEMVICHQCGVHIPVQEAVIGAKGSYCSATHRLAMEP
jgi:uncharacterized protein